MIWKDSPPQGFGGFYNWTAPLRVYYLNDLFWCYDSWGFLCSTDSAEQLSELLRAEAQRKPDEFNRPHYWPRARDLVYPGFAEEQEEKAIKFRNSVPVKPYQKPAPVQKVRLTLKDIGL